MTQVTEYSKRNEKPDKDLKIEKPLRTTNKTNTNKIISKVNKVLEKKVFKSEKANLTEVKSHKYIKDIIQREPLTTSQLPKKTKHKKSIPKNGTTFNSEKINPKPFLELFLILNEKSIIDNNNIEKNKSLFSITNEVDISKNIKQTLESIHNCQNNKHKFCLDVAKFNSFTNDSEIIIPKVTLLLLLILI